MEEHPEAPARAPAPDRGRTRFVFAAAGLLLAFNILQPVLSVFTRLLDPPAIGPLTWGWVLGFCQFAVPLGVLHLHVARCNARDRAASRVAPRGAAAGIGRDG